MPVASDHLASISAGAKKTPQTCTDPIPGVQTDLYGLELWENSVPIIDLGALHGPRRSDIIKHLAHACQQYGFFMVKNHGISEKILNNVMDTAREFFHLPEEEKMKLHSPGDFTSPIRFAPSIKDDDQNIVVSRESLKFLSDPLENYVNLWPTCPSSFREVVAEYCVAAKMAEITLTEAIFESLGVKRASMDKILVKLEQNVSFNYYPTCEKSNLGHTVGLRGHTDPSIITILLSDEVPGLEIFQNGEWILFKPLTNTLTVNVGDILQALSNGGYKSLLHRVAASSDTERLSIVSNCYPSINTQIGPPKELIDDDHPAMYKDFSYKELYDSMWTLRPHDSTRLDPFKVCAD